MTLDDFYPHLMTPGRGGHGTVGGDKGCPEAPGQLHVRCVAEGQVLRDLEYTAPGFLKVDARHGVLQDVRSPGCRVPAEGALDGIADLVTKDAWCPQGTAGPGLFAKPESHGLGSRFLQDRLRYHAGV